MLKLIILAIVVQVVSGDGEVSLGRLPSYAHKVGGEVILLNERQYKIKGLNYDGTAPAAWHVGMKQGTSGVYGTGTYVFRDERNSDCKQIHKKNKNDDIIITIPKNLSLSKDIARIAIYCFKYCVNFGDVAVPEGLTLPPAPEDLPDYELCEPTKTYKPCAQKKVIPIK
ncbi:unnamed protein product [Orchesella dallaii]|uniref:DM13 domain-containing protein n=1 Tax=Orchesella dallaii TaxID=48710 RepID=A0ABP1RD80_9HEXA